jgi:hypothetical protein
MKFVVANLSEIPEAFHAEYEARDGKFYLKTEGEFAPLIEANTKLAEFRDNNRALNAKKVELEGQLAQFKDVNVEEYKSLKTKVTELEKTGVKDKDSVAELIKREVEKAVNPLQETIKQREQSEKAAQEALQRQGLENQLREAGTKAGVDDRAMRDYINRGLEVFKLQEGKAVPRKGDVPLFSKVKPAEELSMDEWARDLQTEAPFLFKPSKGGGAGGGIGADRTQPVRILSDDPIEFGNNLEDIAAGKAVVQ